ncbi:hypothetical protein B0H13DRAFT_2312623 [Mycena leptocephala]|nr:hypothetical protein B0H13DRAFT_2312623 [Mycena leptocephala]
MAKPSPSTLKAKLSPIDVKLVPSPDCPDGLPHPTLPGLRDWSSSPCSSLYCQVINAVSPLNLYMRIPLNPPSSEILKVLGASPQITPARLGNGRNMCDRADEKARAEGTGFRTGVGERGSTALRPPVRYSSLTDALNQAGAINVGRCDAGSESLRDYGQAMSLTDALSHAAAVNLQVRTIHGQGKEARSVHHASLEQGRPRTLLPVRSKFGTLTADSSIAVKVLPDTFAKLQSTGSHPGDNMSITFPTPQASNGRGCEYDNYDMALRTPIVTWRSKSRYQAAFQADHIPNLSFVKQFGWVQREEGNP